MFASANRWSHPLHRSENSRPKRPGRNQAPTNNTTLSQRGPHGTSHKPGDSVLESGIYEVVHDSAHRSAHEVVMITGDHFPACDTCTDKVRFRIIRTAPYIFSDEDFEEEK